LDCGPSLCVSPVLKADNQIRPNAPFIGLPDESNCRPVIAAGPRRFQRCANDADPSRLQLVENRLPVRLSKPLGVHDIDATATVWLCAGGVALNAICRQPRTDIR
jgi:hypothetical protein